MLYLVADCYMWGPVGIINQRSETAQPKLRKHSSPLDQRSGTMLFRQLGSSAERAMLFEAMAGFSVTRSCAHAGR